MERFATTTSRYTLVGLSLSLPLPFIFSFLIFLFMSLVPVIVLAVAFVICFRLISLAVFCDVFPVLVAISCCEVERNRN